MIQNRIMSRLSYNKRGSHNTEMYSSSGGIELEQKLRREAEEKYRKTVQKLDQLQSVLQKRTEELEAEKKLREEVEERNSKLQFTINKLEQYLRKKSITPESSTLGLPDSQTQRPHSSLADVADLEDSLNEKINKLHQEHEKRIQAEERCKQLETKLSAMGLSDDVPQTRNKTNEFVDGELDF